MRAYFAILKDSYREAAASLVLWLAAGGILLLLLAASAHRIAHCCKYWFTASGAD